MFKQFLVIKSCNEPLILKDLRYFIAPVYWKTNLSPTVSEISNCFEFNTPSDLLGQKAFLRITIPLQTNFTSKKPFVKRYQVSYDKKLYCIRFRKDRHFFESVKSLS